MADETVVRVTGDASGYVAEMDRAKRSAASFLQSQEMAAQRTKVAQDAIAEAAQNGATATARQISAFVNSAAKMADSIGKTRVELLEQKAAQLGVSDSVGVYINKMKEAAQATIAQAEASKMAAAQAAHLAEQQRFMESLSLKAQGPISPIDAAAQRGASLGINAAELDPLITKWRQVEQAATEAAMAERSAAESASFISSLNMRAEAIGKTNSELLEMKAAQLGVSAQAAPMIAKLRASEVATVSVGMSAKQTANAMRLIPMQMTDIVTQLAGGQNPLLILTQQGGQLKDVFGGVGPALRGVGTYIAGLINPVTVAIAAFGALTVAYQMGLKESERFNASLVMTGGFAGQTVGGLGAMAKSISDTVGTTSKAADALNQLTATGKISGDSIKEIGTAAVAMEGATGQAVKKTVEEFVKLGEEPAKAIAKLNESQHFLTAAVYEQIAALEAQGRKEDAAALAQKTYSTAIQERSKEVVGNVGLMEKAWNALAKTAKGAWDIMMDIGRDNGLQGKLAEAESTLKQLQGGGALSRSSQARIDAQKAVVDGIKAQIAAQDEQAKSAANQQAIEARGIAAQDAIAKQREQSASKTEQLNKALRDYRKNIEDIRKADPNSAFLDPAKIANDEKNIRDKFKEAKGPATRDDAATRMLMQLKEQEAALNAQLVTSGKLGSVKAELAKFDQQIADIKSKSVLTADQKSLLANEGQLRAQLQKNAAVEQEITLKKEAVKIDALRQSLEASLAADQQQYGERLAATGLGRKAEEELKARQRIIKDYQRQLEQAGRDQLTGAISSETYQQEIVLLQQNLDARLEAQGRYFDSLRTLQSDWRIGASAALADYADMAANVAKSTAGAVTNGFKGMEDALVSFITKGKADFASLADSIISDMVRIAVQQSITGPLAGAIGNLFGGNVSGVADASFVQQAGGDGIGRLISANGWDAGGYTGPGGKYEPAGIVHKGEYVLNQGATQRMGVATLDRINKGYANGGLVGGGAAAGAGNMKVEIINNGTPQQVSKVQRSVDLEGDVIRLFVNDLRRDGDSAHAVRAVVGMA